MGTKRDGGSRRGSTEKRGGYESSSKPVSSLKPPPDGPAPGGAKPAPTGKGGTNTSTPSR